MKPTSTSYAIKYLDILEIVAGSPRIYGVKFPLRWLDSCLPGRL